jgi:hypothetical protein
LGVVPSILPPEVVLIVRAAKRLSQDSVLPLCWCPVLSILSYLLSIFKEHSGVNIMGGVR